jgi:BirA family biotin operon repressor/biotin-[acetyl-CoA-carboxylase] ligase
MSSFTQLAHSTSIVGSAAWRLYRFEETASTNTLAKDLPPWSAIVARVQSGGRGRYSRSFVSDEGGLWISAVVPATPPVTRWSGFSLTVGWYLLDALKALGIANARLRWPNDLMIGSKKVAGLLLEQPVHQTIVVGLGLNVTNAPWKKDPALEATATRLADVLPSPPSIEELEEMILNAVAEAHAEMEAAGLQPAINHLNAHWASHPAVELSLFGGSSVRGSFLGLDPAGNLLLETTEGEQNIPHTSVERLHEIPD